MHCGSRCHAKKAGKQLGTVSLTVFWKAGKSKKGSLVTHFLPGGTVGPGISNRASQALQRRDIMLN